ncbi:MAG: alpha amylase C-terminal domain-containing protein [Clostridiales bacterium]|jgi:1,4-alpha-glucan branching enzyme|nr:alpha amylase C-terminal domain-containing protein [Clostridiales bacterium]
MADYAIFKKDPWLEPYRKDIEMRLDLFARTRGILTSDGKSLSEFANGHLHYGFHRTPDGWFYREWAPAADRLYLIGDFNGWNPESHPMKKDRRGGWEIFVEGADTIKHLSRVKARVVSRGQSRDRIPLYIRKVAQDPATKDFAGQIWEPERPFEWTDGAWMSAADAGGAACGAAADAGGTAGGAAGAMGMSGAGGAMGVACDAGGAACDTGSAAGAAEAAQAMAKPPYIYEAHIGMAQNKDGIGTYAEFAENVLPRIKAGGYNTLQIMALAEHPYYASFGYQVSNFFAPSSWFGTPDDLKALVNAAHRMGIRVLMDLVHSHAVANVYEGINEFDGTQEQFFHPGARGSHSAWGTKLFRYGKYEVIHFLMSNIKYWMSEFHFDGFRFDGVTSMIYLDHGLGTAFDHYDKYFSPNTDFEALAYLSMANEMIHESRPAAVTVAEDMSGLPGMCLPVAEGGIGFDYRLAMGVPDFWVRALKTQSDEQLSMSKMWHELTTRRPYERNIGYCESHDQAMVGDKTIMFWLADKDMYDSMSVFSDNLRVNRAIALHKMIRFATLALAGEGYLNFIGNEFGHPEWIDFPREGNGWSYLHAKRRWDLADRDDLCYKYLDRFDREMLAFADRHGILGASDLRNLWVDEAGKLLAFLKGGVVFLFNFHPQSSVADFELPFPHETPDGLEFRVAFDSDARRFGGQDRISRDVLYAVRPLERKPGNKGVRIYAPARTVLALAAAGGGEG